MNLNFSIKHKGLIFLAGIIFLVLLFLKIWSNNYSVGFGSQFEKINQLQIKLKLENQILENQLAKLESLQYIASASASLGFIPVTDIKYITK